MFNIEHLLNPRNNWNYNGMTVKPEFNQEDIVKYHNYFYNFTVTDKEGKLINKQVSFSANNEDNDNYKEELFKTIDEMIKQFGLIVIVLFTNIFIHL